MMSDDKDEAARPPAFQFYCRDFLTSERVQAMGDKAFRAYVNLLAQAWLSTPIGTIPDDDKMLAALSRVGRQGWASVKKEVLAAFEKRGERWASSKLCRQARELLALSKTRSESARKGAAKRWEKPDNQGRDDGKGIANGMAKNATASASASASAESPPTPPPGADAGLTDNGHDNDEPRWCFSCEIPYEPGETAANHSCVRALKKAGHI